MSDKLVMVFTRNPELGKVKTRLAKTIGNQAALNIYKYLLEHTEKIIRSIDSDKAVFYTNSIENNDLWNDSVYQKHLQQGDDLGLKMSNAFKNAFNENYKKVIIVGSDLPDLKEHHINDAFEQLENHDIALGPAHDGGYYLMGMKKMNELVFLNKEWGTSTVLGDTLKELVNKNVFLLEALNDIDVYEDLKNYDSLTDLI